VRLFLTIKTRGPLYLPISVRAAARSSASAGRGGTVPSGGIDMDIFFIFLCVRGRVVCVCVHTVHCTLYIVHRVHRTLVLVRQHWNEGVVHYMRWGLD
jgi:hypothetical protein